MRALLVLPLVLLLTGCPAGERCSGEEAAYVEEVLPFLESTGLPSPECTVDPRTRSMLFQQAGVWKPQLVKLDEAAEQLKLTAPPEAFQDLHTKLVELVEFQVRLEGAMAQKRAVSRQFWRWIGRGNEKAELIEALRRDSLELQTERDHGVLDARALIADVNAEIRRRPRASVYASHEAWLVFEPHGTDLQLGVGQSGTFSVDWTPEGVPTPFGQIGMKFERTGGVRRLVIRAGGMQRILKLDRPFRLFVPASHGFEIVSETQDVLIIHVHDRA